MAFYGVEGFALCNWESILLMEYIRSINWVEEREDVIDLFRRAKFEFLTFTEMKMKRNWEVSLCGVNGISSCAREMERNIVVLPNAFWLSLD